MTKNFSKIKVKIIARHALAMQATLFTKIVSFLFLKSLTSGLSEEQSLYFCDLFFTLK